VASFETQFATDEGRLINDSDWPSLPPSMRDDVESNSGMKLSQTCRAGVKRRWTRKKNAKAYRRAVIPFALGRTAFNWTERASGGTAASGSDSGSGSASAVRTSHFAQRLPAATPKERLLHLVDVLCAPGCIRSRRYIIQTVRLGPPQKSSVRLVTGFRNEAPAATLPLAVSTAEVTVRIPRGRLPHLAEHIRQLSCPKNHDHDARTGAACDIRDIASQEMNQREVLHQSKRKRSFQRTVAGFYCVVLLVEVSLLRGGMA
jgi:hypothetical protein